MFTMLDHGLGNRRRRELVATRCSHVQDTAPSSIDANERQESEEAILHSLT